MKKLFAILVVFSLIFTVAACSNNRNDEETTTAPTSDETFGITDTVGSEADTSAEPSSEITTEGEIPSGQETTTALTEQTTLAADPSQWTTEEIVEFYKAAAAKSQSVKSSQVMSMTKLVVNNGDGALGFLINMVEPLFVAALERNSTEFDGITGGYANLTASDLQSAKAYKSGNYIIVEMRPKEQTDGIDGDVFSGTVGHAISVVDGVDDVLKEFPKLNVNLDEALIAINYTKPVVKVKINNNGIIEKGTWSYTVDVDVENLEIEKISVKTADALVDYVITVGGGF